MIAIIDYGVGNLFSLKSSLKMIGAEAVVTGDAAAIRASDKIILPGVGAFADAAAKLRATGLDQVVIAEAKAGKPLLGICLGMQLLFDRSLEYGEHKGLGLIPGSVEDLKPDIPADLKVPHIGWNALNITRPHPLLKYVKAGDYVYFVHSYYCTVCEDTAAVAHYTRPFSAALHRDNFYATQFHPEKSGPVGEAILRNFLNL